MKGVSARIFNEKHRASFKRLFICSVHIIIPLVELYKLIHNWESGKNTIDLYDDDDVANVND
jgi:hypothetical protein